MCGVGWRGLLLQCFGATHRDSPVLAVKHRSWKPGPLPFQISQPAGRFFGAGAAVER